MDVETVPRPRALVDFFTAEERCLQAQTRPWHYVRLGELCQQECREIEVNSPEAIAVVEKKVSVSTAAQYKSMFEKVWSYLHQHKKSIWTATTQEMDNAVAEMTAAKPQEGSRLLTAVNNVKAAVLSTNPKLRAAAYRKTNSQALSNRPKPTMPDVTRLLQWCSDQGPAHKLAFNALTLRTLVLFRFLEFTRTSDIFFINRFGIKDEEEGVIVPFIKTKLEECPSKRVIMHLHDPDGVRNALCLACHLICLTDAIAITSEKEAQKIVKPLTISQKHQGKVPQHAKQLWYYTNKDGLFSLLAFDTLGSKIRKLFKELKFEGITPKHLRHAGYTFWKDLGVDDATLAKTGLWTEQSTVRHDVYDLNSEKRVTKRKKPEGTPASVIAFPLTPSKKAAVLKTAKGQH